jgi:hypothetical protein
MFEKWACGEKKIGGGVVRGRRGPCSDEADRKWCA